MTRDDILRDIRAATLSHIAYERFAQDLGDEALDHVGTIRAKVAARSANYAQRAAFAEMVDPEPDDLPDDGNDEREAAVRAAQRWLQVVA